MAEALKQSKMASFLPCFCLPASAITSLSVAWLVLANNSRHLAESGVFRRSKLFFILIKGNYYSSKNKITRIQIPDQNKRIENDENRSHRIDYRFTAFVCTDTDWYGTRASARRVIDK